jgi:hypothetical protein
MTDNFIPAEGGSHAWHGNCDPARYHHGYPTETFSVGCFQWLPKAKGGLKRGPALVRVYGSTSKPELVYAKAKQICKELDAGTYVGPKNVRV